MFGQNEIVGKKYFRDAQAEQGEAKLFVTSMFMTLQGEGPYRGQPAFFVRLSKCNLACSFCDTFFDDGDWMTFDEIENRIETTIDDFYKSINMDRPEWTRHTVGGAGNQQIEIDSDAIAIHGVETAKAIYGVSDTPTKKRMVLVMTGGEPMLQENINPFLERMTSIFENTQIESNGTADTEIPATTTLVISPKCMEKKNAEGVMVATKYLAPRPAVLDRASCLKFVMEATEGSPYSVVPDWAHEWARKTGRQVFVSPMNIYNDIPAMSKKQRALNNQITLDERSTVDEKIDFWESNLLDMTHIERNHKYVANYCVTHGFVFNMQMHLFAGLA